MVLTFQINLSVNLLEVGFAVKELTATRIRAHPDSSLGMPQGVACTTLGCTKSTALRTQLPRLLEMLRFKKMVIPMTQSTLPGTVTLGENSRF